MKRIDGWATTRWVAVTGAMVSLLCAGTARAQSVHFDGYTNGCFHTDGGTCTPEEDQAGRTDVVQQSSRFGATTVLSYTNADFFADVLAGGAPVNVTLGTFSLGGPVVFSDFFDDDFSFRASFINPTSGSKLFDAEIFGGFLLWQGGAYIDFDNTPFVFGDRDQYRLQLEDVALGKGVVNDVTFDLPSSALLTGTLSAAQVTPEPVSIALLGTGLLGLGAVLRRRQRTGAEGA
jgi:hypothetical protein